MTGTTIDEIRSLVYSAFENVDPPPSWCLVKSFEGDEPSLLEQEFSNKREWKSLDAKFLNQASNGYSSALSFFSDEAFRCYLPAYMIADLDDKLPDVNIVSHLTLSFSDAQKEKAVNPRRYGHRTWQDVGRYKFSIFSQDQKEAIKAYLMYKASIDEFDSELINQAFRNYWNC